MAEWVFTVSEAGEFVKRSLDAESLLQNILIRGEISDLRRASSGHIYFSLKDARALLRCAWFRQDQRNAAAVTEGMRVVTRGRISYYMEQGQINFYVKEVKPDGVGNLYLLFEQRKARFREKGYFDEELKRPLPSFPRVVGVVTSPTGAVIRDIIRVARRRNPGVKVVLYPVRVQGEGAAAEIAGGIAALNRHGEADVLIVGRGGGSFEDLWEFNDEAVVSAIRASRIPVVTAVGHETDFTLADFAADMRAATPSEAAELTVPDVAELGRRVRVLGAQLRRQYDNMLVRREQRVAFLMQALDLHGPRDRLNRAEMQLDNLRERMHASMDGSLARLDVRLDSMRDRLNALSPAAVFERGYAAVYSPARRAFVSRGAGLAAGEDVALLFADVRRGARITDERGGTDAQEDAARL